MVKAPVAGATQATSLIGTPPVEKVLGSWIQISVQNRLAALGLKGLDIVRREMQDGYVLGAIYDDSCADLDAIA